MWTLYDELIEEIPSNRIISDVYQTNHWMFIVSENVIGTGMKFEKSTFEELKKYKGANVQEVASLIKSWNFHEASIGLAAVNSYFNQSNQINQEFLYEKRVYRDAFEQIAECSSDTKIGMIGHFPYVDRLAERPANIYIFELDPRNGDYPASASEFLLPEMDLVYITASTIVNKTLPRLLELSNKAKTILVGSSCPLAASLFHHEIDTLAGTIYQDSLETILRKKETTGLSLSKYGLPTMIGKKKG